jgi:NADH:ubiquinone oxidoreductase subunit E
MCTSTCTVPCLGGRHNYAPPPPPPPSALASMQYPLYDRSSVDDDEIPVSRIAAKVAKKECDIHVCHAGTCRSRGAEAVLTEIEELVNSVYNAKQAKLILSTMKTVSPEDAADLATTVVDETVFNDANSCDMALMAVDRGNCTVRASGCLGYCSEAPNALVQERGARASAENVHTRLLSLEASAKLVQRATGTKPALDDPGGRLSELRAVRARQHSVKVSHWNAALAGLAEQAAQRPALRTELAALLANAGFADGVVGAKMPSAIANYSPWLLEGVRPVTKHSAVFTFASKDRKRGTPHPRA